MFRGTEERVLEVNKNLADGTIVSHQRLEIMKIQKLLVQRDEFLQKPLSCPEVKGEKQMAAYKLVQNQ